MTHQGFDPRYPLEFQRGGEAVETQLLQPAPPLSAPPEPDSPREPAALEATAPEASEQTQLTDDVVSQVGSVSQVSSVDPGSEAPLPEQHTAGRKAWGRKVWLVGLGSVIVCQVLGLLLLFSYNRTPQSGSGMELNSGFYSVSWVYLAVLLGPFVMIAGLAVLAGLLIVAAPQRSGAYLWLRSAAALVGVVILAVGMVAYFSGTLFPDIIYGDSGASGSQQSYPWYSLMASIAMPLTLLGSAILTVLVATRTHGSRSYRIDAGRTVVVGLVLTAGALIALFAPQIFPQSLEIPMSENAARVIPATPWPASLMLTGPALVLVGLATLLVGLVAKASSRQAVLNG